MPMLRFSTEYQTRPENLKLKTQTDIFVTEKQFLNLPSVKAKARCLAATQNSTNKTMTLPNLELLCIFPGVGRYVNDFKLGFRGPFYACQTLKIALDFNIITLMTDMIVFVFWTIAR